MQLLSNICTVLVCLQLGIIDGYVYVVDASRIPGSAVSDLISRNRRGAVSDLISRNRRGAVSDLISRNRRGAESDVMSMLIKEKQDKEIQRKIRGTHIGSLIVGADYNATKNVSLANSLYPVVVDLKDLTKMFETRFSSLSAQIAEMKGEKIGGAEASLNGTAAAELNRMKVQLQEYVTKIHDLTKKVNAQEANITAEATEIEKLRRKIEDMEAEATGVEHRINQTNTYTTSDKIERDLKIALKNENVECWGNCGRKGGPCSFCGGGSCCRKGWKDAGCILTKGCKSKHCCVE